MLLMLYQTKMIVLQICGAIEIVADTFDNLWRPGLIEWLCRADDFGESPVTSLREAKLTMAQTHSLDEACILPSGEGAPYWNPKKLTDIQPDLLLSHQVAEGKLGAGSFYWQFQHDESGLDDYMEGKIFPTLGLVATVWANSDLDLWAAILVAYEEFLGNINSEGMFWERLSQEGSVNYI